MAASRPASSTRSMILVGGDASLALSDKHTCMRSSGPGPKRLSVGGQAGQKPGCADRGQVPERVGAGRRRVTPGGDSGLGPPRTPPTPTGPFGSWRLPS